MISYLKGQVIRKTNKSVVLEVGGIGYTLFIPPKYLAKIKVESQQAFFTHLQSTETAMNLYGFFSWDELGVFEQLISVSGIGPKSAIGVLELATPEDLRLAIIAEDATVLTKVSGIGKKTAERIILELKNKITELPGDAASHPDLDVVDALESLGYSRVSIQEVLRKIPKDLDDAESKIKAALKFLGK